MEIKSFGVEGIGPGQLNFRAGNRKIKSSKRKDALLEPEISFHYAGHVIRACRFLGIDDLSRHSLAAFAQIVDLLLKGAAAEVYRAQFKRAVQVQTVRN